MILRSRKNLEKIILYFILIGKRRKTSFFCIILKKERNNKEGGKINMKKTNETNVLDELNKGACMGIDAIHFTLSKVKDSALKEELENQKRHYEKISNEIHEHYKSEKEPHEPNKMEKAMTWYGIEMRTMMDDSTSKIAELLLKGTNMGIIEGKKLLNHKELTPEIKDLIEEYIAMQERAVEKLKTFL